MTFARCSPTARSTSSSGPRRRGPDVEGVRGDPVGEAGSNGGRGRAAGLATGLILERGKELGDEVEPREALERLGPERCGPGAGVAAGDVEPGAFAQEMALDVERRIDRSPHVAD